MLPALVIHGGAGDVDEKRALAKLKGVQIAAREGWKLLNQSGGSALDAVEAAVRVMEDDENFNAGTGSVLNLDGDVEMDALIMEGHKLNAGAVAAMRDVKNAVSVARLVMEKSEHILIVGQGANRFAEAHGVPRLEPGALITDYEINCLEDVKNKRKGNAPGVGTVGAVAVDKEGRVAVALSTGGTCGKTPGRVGDTPLLGCGGYCDEAVGAVASTGHGESITKACLASTIFNLMKQGVPVQDAAEQSCEFLTARTGGTAGAIAVSKDGHLAVAHTTDKMSWATVSNGELRAGVKWGEEVVEKI
ncbi:isoaspartyl peptidase/L-asparaginase [Neocloeon triangulifer]|uniref:isoaspartyl peptidase/L-asparaginase n=1 Tax=Neocloeon triangulifer TaxID=2078957 RepID=UPI00286F0CEB|nr:isoaspartyl peptidase/L-asparaginase [Neocloeon triangulifer]